MAYTFTMTRVVEFAETDMAGIVHFANFFRWMESCETAFYRSLGLPLISFVPGEVVGWPRVTVSCDYRIPVRFNEVISVTLFVKKIGTRSVTYLFRISRDDVRCAEGEMTVVCVTGDGQGGMVAQVIPAAIRVHLEVAPATVLS